MRNTHFLIKSQNGRLAVLCLLLILLLYSSQAENLWEKTNGPYGGTVWSFEEGINGIVLGGTSNGLFLSSDNGNTWNKVFSFIIPANLFKMAKNSKGIVYGASIGTIVKSDSSYTDWMPYKTGLGANNVNALAINSKDEIFAGMTNKGVYRRAEGDSAWKQVITGIDSVTVLSLTIDSNDGIFAGTAGKGFFHSSNNGDTWDKIDNIIASFDVSSLIIANNTLFAGTLGHGVFISVDNGLNWNPVNNGIVTFDSIIKSLQMIDDNIYAGTNNGIYKTNVLGMNWEKVSTAFDNEPVQSMMKCQNGAFLAGCYHKGCFISKDGGSSFSQIIGKINTTPINALLVNNDGAILAGTKTAGLFRSKDNGNSWEQPVSDIPALTIQSLFWNSNNLYAGTSNSGIYMSSDNGDSWANIGLTGKGSVTSIKFDINGVMFASSNMGVFRYQSGDTGWVEINNGLANARNIKALAITKEGVLFAGYSGYNGGVFRSLDKGDNWVKVDSGLGSTSSNALSINSKGFIYNCTNDGGVYRSKDNGDYWERINNGIDANRIYSISISSSDEIFIGTYNYGAYKSVDDGDNWVQMSDGLDVQNVYSLAVNHEGILFAGTGYQEGVSISGNGLGGVYRTIRQVAPVKDIAEDLNNLIISPNPITDKGRITFKILEPSNINCELYDLLGNKAGQLYSGFSNQINNEIIFEANSFYSGVYILRLNIQNIILNKMIIIN